MAGSVAAGAGILSSILSSNATDAAANSAAQAQEQLQQQALAYLQQAGSQQRTAINNMLPYSQGASTAADAAQYSAPYLAPGQGMSFASAAVYSMA